MASKKMFTGLAAASAAAILGVGTIGSAPMAAHAAVPAKAVRTISGMLQPNFGLAAPTTLTIKSPRGMITVNVSSTTQVVRRYNGDSSLAELSPNDNLIVKGYYQNSTTISATWIKDVTIQRAFTFMVGRVKAVSGSNITVTVIHDGRYKRQDPWILGETITLNTSSSTAVVNANGTAGTLSSITPHMRIAPLGVANRKGHSMTTVYRIRILG